MFCPLPPGALRKHGPIPLYYQLHRLFLRAIRRGEWRPNQRLPNEDSLAVFYQVSKITVRQALRDLEQDGLIRREQGRGTFVAEPKLEHGPRELTSFSEEMGKLGKVASSHVLACEVMRCPPDIAGKLNLAGSGMVFHLRRTRLAGGEPLAIQTAWIPAALVNGIERTDFTHASLYRVLAEEFGLIPERAVEVHRAMDADAGEAALLGVRRSLACLSVERATVLPDGRPMELVYSLFRGDRYEIRLELVRRV